MAAILSVEATLRFKVRTILLSGAFVFANPRSFCSSAAIQARSSDL
ncbi:hypothetical protein JQ615_05625 [Bradyrhizobium jicamae]|uniref:Uncharacterized protein n=1 Tax=Bradyrhizobium jicamae TaxID=280332 RepID=A0ABS5FDJ8_9BRAD|nr:hypothetical protein [Bradyrhizobium jicamae]MBR0794870.1 hypothetical protein [Bradyrhizobium jicamae]